MSTKRRKDAPAPLSQRELDTLQGATVGPQITPGASASRGCDNGLSPDISIGQRRGHFYWGGDNLTGRLLSGGAWRVRL
jgi:hypothetical protein